MGHLVLAAKQLIEEVRDADPKAKVTILPEQDGLGFHREVRIEGENARAIADVIEADRRILDVKRSPKGVRVVFKSSTLADHRTSYHLAEALAVLSED